MGTRSRRLVAIGLTVVVGSALAPGLSFAASASGSEVDGRLLLTKPVVQPDEAVGLRVQNNGSVGLSFGYGATVERRRGRRWVDVQDQFCPRGCPAPGVALVAPPGTTVGGGRVRVPRAAKPGLYRITKLVSTVNRPRRSVALRATMRVKGGRLILTRRSIEPGQRTGIRVANASRHRMVFGLGATAERWEGEGWVDAQSEFCPDGCPVPSIALAVGPRTTVGPRHRGLLDTVRFPLTIPPGLYRLSKRVSVRGKSRQWRIRLHAHLRVRAPE